MEAIQERRGLAVITGASSGIGLALAHEFADHGYDPVIAVEDAGIETAAQELRADVTDVVAVASDLSTYDGVEDLCSRVPRTRTASPAPTWRTRSSGSRRRTIPEKSRATASRR